MPGCFDALTANMNRDGFAAHMGDDARAVKRPAEALLAVVGDGLKARRGLALTPRLLRIYRDARGSSDKPPCNTHLHLQWPDKASGIGFLLGAGRSSVAAGVAAMAIAPARLTAGARPWRVRRAFLCVFVRSALTSFSVANVSVLEMDRINNVPRPR